MDVTKHRFTVEEYHLMGEAGIFGEDDRVELVGGEVIELVPIGWRHAQAVNGLTHLLVERAAGRTVSVQNPLVVDELNERLPDLVLLREGARGRLPEARDALLVVEVSDSSLRYDRENKLPLYAGAGVPEVWIVNLPEERIEVHTHPGPGGYARARRARGDEEVPSPTVPGIRASQILA
jgi:Uma2 family endonuclease